MSTELSQIPGLGRPARGALLAAGFTSLEALDGADRARLATLHGLGPRGLERLQAVLAQRGLALSGEIPAPGQRDAVLTRGGTGMRAEDSTTPPTEAGAEDFIASLPWPRRVEDGRALLELFAAATGDPPVMWGPSMIGCGRLHYRYATGREGDTFRVGFSPRRAALSLYGLQGHPHSEQLLSRLGKHRLGKGCVYVTTLDDIRTEVLRDLIRHAWDTETPEPAA